MLVLLLIVLLVLALGGGGYYGRRAGWGPRGYGLGLVLTGGGARSAYQIGVLRALAEIFPRGRSPFQVIVGTSARAVAASVLAAEAVHGHLVRLCSMSLTDGDALLRHRPEDEELDLVG